MVQLALAFIAAALISVQASPLLEKRIAQTIADSLTKWQAACLAASNNSPQCNELAVPAFTTLLAASGPCDQQDNADKLMDFSKQQNSQEMIALAQVFCQQPRNSPNSVSVPYCQQAPKNPELNGLYQCQFKGDNPKVFVGGLAVGAPGTIPFGMTSPLNPPGSCPANPGGPIADGTQLTDITTVPFASGSSSPAADPASTSSTTPADPSSTSTTPADPDSDSCPAAPATSDATPSTTSPSMQTSDGATAASLAASTNAPAAASLSKADLLANGEAAQKLNAQFATLTAGSSCDAGENACVNGQFAQCVGGNFVLSPCASTLQCYALPLLLKTGTSVTCDTEADAEARIANTGATGGITGS
jgi:hypothetical protein